MLSHIRPSVHKTRLLDYRCILQRRSRRHSQHREEKNETQIHACIGPSLLHNLLPILEFLVLINPKLYSIEERIIGRQRQHYPQAPCKIPSSLVQLNEWVEEASISCECDECAPCLYKLTFNSSHSTVQYANLLRIRKTPKFQHVQVIPAGLPPRLSRRLYGDYETMRLVRAHITWLTKTYLESPPRKPDTSILQLESLLESWKPHLTSPDLRQSMSSIQLLHLFSLLNNIFFFGAIPPHRSSISAGFSWLPDTRKDCFGISSFNPIIGTQILLHPMLYRGQNVFPRDHPEDMNLRWRNRLGTILHEMCHAFLKAYSCRSCPGHDLCMGARGHGRAWQLMAAKIEQVATKLMSGFVDLGRYPSLLNEIQGSGKLPSSHDLEVYQFGERWESTQL